MRAVVVRMEVTVLDLAVTVRVCVETPSPPAHQQAHGEHDDHEPHRQLGAALHRLGQVRVERARSAARTASSVVAWPKPQARPRPAARRVPSSARTRSAWTRPRGGPDRWRGAGRAASATASTTSSVWPPASPAIDWSRPGISARAPCEQRRRHRRLAVGDAAVVRRQRLGREHAQAGRRQALRGGLEQPPVLEHAAGQHHRRGVASRRRSRQASAVASARALWKRAATTPAGTPSAMSCTTAAIVGRASRTVERFPRRSGSG